MKGPGGYTTEPAPQPQGAPATYGGDPNASGNDFTSSPPLGPQQNLGQRINRTVHYVAGDYIAPPIVYDAFAPGNKGLNYRSRSARAVFELPLGQYNAYVGAEARQYAYPSGNRVVTTLGGRGFVPGFTATEFDQDIRAGIKVTGPRIYGAVSYLRARQQLRAQPARAGLRHREAGRRRPELLPARQRVLLSQRGRTVHASAASARATSRSAWCGI